MWKPLYNLVENIVFLEVEVFEKTYNVNINCNCGIILKVDLDTVVSYRLCNFIALNKYFSLLSYTKSIETF